MGKTITIEDDVYNVLCSLKQGSTDSFSKVLRRHVYQPVEQAGELLDAYEDEEPPKVAPKAFEQLIKQRGRRSGGRK